MKTTATALCLVVSLLLGCTNDQPDRARLAKAKQAKQEALARLTKEIQLLEAASKNVAERLKMMKPEDQVTVATLVILMGATSSLEGKSSSLGRESTTRIANNISSVSPIVGKAWSGNPIMAACLNESIAYVSALSRCEKDGKTEDECVEAQEAAAQEVMCMMNRIDLLKKMVRDIYGGIKPPRPTPWPDM